jgi:hypothetical protein
MPRQIAAVDQVAKTHTSSMKARAQGPFARVKSGGLVAWADHAGNPMADDIRRHQFKRLVLRVGTP